MKIKETSYKWENFDTDFVSSIEETHEIYAVSLNENEAGIITHKDGEIEMNRYVNSNSLIASKEEDRFSFDNIKECLQYLRAVREDHANNYDYKELVKKLISHLYLNNIVKPEDIIS